MVKFGSAGEVFDAGFKLLDMVDAGEYKFLDVTVSTNDEGDGIKFFVPIPLPFPAFELPTPFGRLKLARRGDGTQVVFVPGLPTLKSVLEGGLAASKLFQVLSESLAQMGGLASPAGVAVVAACVAGGLLKLSMSLAENQKQKEKEEEEKEEEGSPSPISLAKKKKKNHRPNILADNHTLALSGQREGDPEGDREGDRKGKGC